MILRHFRQGTCSLYSTHGIHRRKSPSSSILMVSSSLSTDSSDVKKYKPMNLECLEGLNIDKEMKMKTGAQMRKVKRQEMRVERVKVTEMYALQNKIKNRKRSAEEENSRIRFTLGSGIEVLTSASLIELVKITAPYYFPSIIDDEDSLLYFTDENPTFPLTMTRNNNDHHINLNQSLGSQESLRLSEYSSSPNGWLDILRSQSLPQPSESPPKEDRIDYFTLCLACHFASVATYVPTDVDSKIRGHCWFDPDEDVLVEQFEVLKNALKWDVTSVSKRAVLVPGFHDPISGHNGEWLGVLVGAFGAFLRIGRADLAAEAEQLIASELQREADAFKSLRLMKPSNSRDTLILKMSAILTHNVGDVDQGYSYWADNLKTLPQFAKYSKLAHEHFDRFGGEFYRAKVIYKDLLSAEGHRNYPLREAKALRTSPDFMLPIGPWLESWGRTVATHPTIGEEDLLLIMKQLIRGCDSKSKAWCVPNQIGYYRAIQGITNSGRNFDRLLKHLDKDCRAFLTQHEMKIQLGITEDAFAAKLGQRVRELLISMP